MRTYLHGLHLKTLTVKQPPHQHQFKWKYGTHKKKEKVSHPLQELYFCSLAYYTRHAATTTQPHLGGSEGKKESFPSL